MNGFWRIWMILWCTSVGGFGLIITLGAIEATSAPTILLLEILGGGAEVDMTPHLRFALAVMGPVTLGWALTLVGATEATRHLPPPMARRIWLWITAGVLGWVIIDSILSVATGFALNLIPNAIYLAAFLIPVMRSGALQT
ncbi:hypothetical protein [uncultured Roseobacter sp.]|uniref:hypothetical protein n=1 Tax=uncultured Roseobacter sp. TaxID=114847 RepID=UPI0026164C95|nr:hypothetical protein [uncultured Roseobacter sp.]